MNQSMRLLRRDVLLSGIGALAAWGVAGAAPAPVPTTAAPDAVDPDIARFMDISHCLTDRTELDSAVGAALYAGIVQASAERKAQIAALYDLKNKHRLITASELAKAAEKADKSLKDAIHDIMVGWYRGVAGGKVVVYRTALMFDITKDAIYPKTYAAGGPFYWTSKPPEVARPTGLPALSPSPFVVEPT
ncbi:sorbitol dehydrogenase [Acetobacter ghanensis]|uniref:Sorbitol dehydrogenase n=2 Tax=Acetobacter ghanensis TaxID=431306 RepID=A0ABX0KP53_9PROT|nr:sorbitol dehydrogenase [Acetobacter ghanensis]